MYVLVCGTWSLAEDRHSCPTSQGLLLFVSIHNFALVVLVILLARYCAGGASTPLLFIVRCCHIRGGNTYGTRMNAIIITRREI